MKISLILFLLLNAFLHNPLLALFVIVAIYYLSDQYYFGFLPALPAVFRRLFQIQRLQKDHQVNPDNANVTYDLGTLHFERKSWQKAREYFMLAAQKMPEVPMLDCLLGVCEMELGHVQEGRMLLHRAIQHDPEVRYGLPYIYLLWYELEHDRNPEMIRWLEDTLKHYSNVENLYRIGLLYLRRENKLKAREFFAQGIRDYSHYPRGMRRPHRKWFILAWFRRAMAW